MHKIAEGFYATNDQVEGENISVRFVNDKLALLMEEGGSVPESTLHYQPGSQMYIQTTLKGKEYIFGCRVEGDELIINRSGDGKEYRLTRVTE